MLQQALRPALTAHGAAIMKNVLAPTAVAVGRHVMQAVRWKTVRHSRWTDKGSGDKLRTQLQKTLGAQPPARKQQASAMFAIIRDATYAKRPDFEEAFRICGLWRDQSTLELLLRMAKARAVELTPKEYAELIMSTARLAGGPDGRGVADQPRQRALQLGRTSWYEMIELGHQPNLEHMRAVLHLSAKAGDADWAWETWAEMGDRQIRPDAEALRLYIEAMAQDAGWDVVEAELACVDKKRVAFDQQMLVALLNAAGVQRQLEKVEWVWRTVVPMVEVSASSYCEKARALLLCDEAESVTRLRAEMEDKGIAPIFKNFLFEAQALLMMVIDRRNAAASDVQGALFEGLRRTLGLAQQQRSFNPQAMHHEDVSFFDQLQALFDRLAAGELVERQELRVIV